jgi:hypothetical protein
MMTEHSEHVERRICLNCGGEFVISEEQVRFFHSRFDDHGQPLKLPKRCAPCRRAARRERGAASWRD